jgi:glycosyltransferase involved in cell wall biosynthesis
MSHIDPRSREINMDPSWVAYLGPFQFPWGQPGSRRVYGVAQSIAATGRRVVVASGPSDPMELTRLDGRPDAAPIWFAGMGELPATDAGIARKLMRILVRWGARTAQWLDDQPDRPSHVIVYGGAAPYMRHLRSWCSSNKVPLVADVVEWYDPCHERGGMFGPMNLSTLLARHFYYPQCDGIIAISSYLALRFQRKVRCVVQVPPTLDVNEVNSGYIPRDAHRPIRLSYSGTPGKKDLLATIISALVDIDPQGSKFALTIAGPTAAEVRRLCRAASLLPSITVLGQIEQRRVAQLLRESDYSVLLREPSVSSNAGFPTKFVESLAAGTPVVTNLTSDLGQHMHDTHEGLVVPNPSASAFSHTLTRLLGIDDRRYLLMREAARKRAVEDFDVGVHVAAIDTFLSKVRL